ncbi:hypothetical protein [Streptomyces subrutilus]|uniref:Uncharacterized protein n=1 Tax=Streptomyces subrutilus TaxID=36818 RepID=A0A1E5Q0L5_9ACTN|nr:hypothetical protein [Streptomyces subrutilus]OEJ35220.1 hypothetical protein BGK67_31430 [Streptomyces subrutilus]
MSERGETRVGTSGEDGLMYVPDEEEVLEAVGSLGRPSTAEEVATRVDERTGRGGAAPSASVVAVLGVLRELEKSARVKSYTPEQWRALGVSVHGAAPYTRLWWSVEQWRETAVSGGQRYQRDRRGREPRGSADEESPVTANLQRIAEQFREQYRSRNRFEGPGAS